jgi:putative ABC transport system permease protein
MKHQDEVLWSELKSIIGVNQIVAMNEIPGTELYWRNDGVGRKANAPVPATFSWLGIGAGYMELFKIDMAAGRDFNPVKDNFDSSLILNESAVEVLGFENPQNAVGQKIYLGDHALEVVGLVRDFKQEGFKKLVEPQYFRYAPNDLNYFVADINPMPEKELIESAYQRVFPGAPFEMYSLADHYDKQYASEKLLARLILFLSVIALVIAIVGIVGMSLQILQKKSKELIIRKIHGASGLQLWNQVAFIFYRIALVAYIISAPLAYFVFNKWTERFTVGDFPILEFLAMPLFILAVLVVLSITFQTIKLTQRNPKDVLLVE